MIGCIYKVTNLINNKVYIGQTVQTLKDRWYRHCSKAKHLSKSEQNTYFKRAILKYGKENFKIEILENCDNKLLNDREIYYISLYKSNITGYNLTAGGYTATHNIKFTNEEVLTIIDLYNYGLSLRIISKEFNVDKATIKNVLIKNDIELRKIRNYKFTTEIRSQIIKDFERTLDRKTVCKKYNISKSYLCQLLKHNRRI